MKDFTVYTQYELFVNQLAEFNLKYRKIRTNTIHINQYEQDMLNTKFITDLSKKCYTKNDMVLTLHYADNVYACIYAPCVDQYQKQYIVCVLYIKADEDSCTLIDADCFKEAINPTHMTKANIEYICDVLNNLTDLYTVVEK